MSLQQSKTRYGGVHRARRASEPFRQNPWSERKTVNIPPIEPVRAPSLTFIAGATTVTGGKFLVEGANSRVLIDCGLFDGPATALERNWPPSSWNLHQLDAIVLSSSRLGNCGYLPVLASQGWSGPVFVTPGSAELIPFSFTECTRLSAEDAAEINAIGWSESYFASPFFHAKDTADASLLLRAVDYGVKTRIADGVELEFGSTGHILGSAWIRLQVGERTVVFSGVLGGRGHPFLKPPQPRPDCDSLVVTCGHRSGNGLSRLEKSRFAMAIHRAVKKEGSVVIPIVGVDQIDTLLLTLQDMVNKDMIPDLPVYVDSPTGLAALAVRKQASASRWSEMKAKEPEPISLRVVELRSRADSARFLDPTEPCIVLAAAGIAGHGRVQRHLSRMLPDPRNALLLLDYLAPDTLSYELAQGSRQIKIYGRYIPINAEVTHYEGFEIVGNANQVRAWAKAGATPEVTYFVNGEDHYAQEQARRFHADTGWCSVAPSEGERVLL